MKNDEYITDVYLTEDQNKELFNKGELKIEWCTISIKRIGENMFIEAKAEKDPLVKRELKIHGLKTPSGIPLTSFLGNCFKVIQEGVHDNTEFIY